MNDEIAGCLGVVLIIIAIIIVAMIIGKDKQVTAPVDKPATEIWSEISPPPGEEGPCYKYEIDGYQTLALTVWCVD